MAVGGIDGGRREEGGGRRGGSWWKGAKPKLTTSPLTKQGAKPHRPTHRSRDKRSEWVYVEFAANLAISRFGLDGAPRAANCEHTPDSPEIETYIYSPFSNTAVLHPKMVENGVKQNTMPLLGVTEDLEYGSSLGRAEEAGPIKNELGTINGVYVPCLLNILGAVLFLRIGRSMSRRVCCEAEAYPIVSRILRLYNFHFLVCISFDWLVLPQRVKKRVPDGLCFCGCCSFCYVPRTLKPNANALLTNLYLGYSVGYAGIIYTLFIFIASFTTTVLTALSFSAIVTNGKMKGGGPYFMISRSMGPAFGGATGLMFYLW